MSDIYSKCGMNCGHCPWSKHTQETMTNEEYESFRDKCLKVLGYRPTQYFQNCLGCQTPDEKIPKGSPIPLRNCPIRICATKTGVKNCAYCSRFPCKSVKALGTEWTREKFEAKHKAPIPEEDYLVFIEPFEGLKHLKAIRTSLQPDNIVEPATFPPLKTQIVDFPKDLPVSESEKKAFKALYELLTILLSSDADTYAGQAAFKKRRQFTYNALWIFGHLGRFVEENGGYLVVDGNTFMREKKRLNLTHWEARFQIMKNYGIHVKRVSLTEKEWSLRMFFDQKVGDAAALKALQKYTAVLDKKYGKKALQHFSKVDMHVLSKN